MKKWLILFMLMMPCICNAEEMKLWQLITEDGQVMSEIAHEPFAGDVYIAADNKVYEVVIVRDAMAVIRNKGVIQLPDTAWLNADTALPVMNANSKRIALYCTHSDESYSPSDGYYSTRERGTIYQVAQELADELQEKGIEVQVAETLHHPHDAGAYRRSRQTAVQLLKYGMPDCLIDVHRDGIPNPASYAVTIGGEKVSKIRLLVGRGNQNADVNKEFALMIKAVADRVYPGLIKDIYMGKGTYNQDLLPRSILLECGTYTLEKERVLASMPMMADVLNRSLYGGVVGSVGRVRNDSNGNPQTTAGITQGQPDTPISHDEIGVGSGLSFLGAIIGIGIVGIAFLSAGSWKRGMHKVGRSISEMTGGIIGKKPDADEENEHS